MNGHNSYWIAGNASAATTTPSPPATPDSSFSNDRNLHDAAPITRRPQAYVAIHPNSNITWVPSPQHNGTHGSVIVVAGKERNVPVVQHVPPRHQRMEWRNPCNGIPSSESGLSELDIANGLVSSSTAHSEVEVPSEPVNYRDDIELDDKALVTISTKELNRRLKKKGITKSRQKEIKSERRTLKNRGYASNCRISREDEEKMLEKDIAKLEEENKKYPPLEELETEWRTLRADCQHLKQLMGITDDDSEFSLSDIETENEIKQEYDEEIRDQNDDDQYTSSDEHDSDH